MNYNKKLIQRAVAIALISAGIIPAAHAEVKNENVNNPEGTTIEQVNNPYAVGFTDPGPFTVINSGTISGSKTTN